MPFVKEIYRDFEKDSREYVDKVSKIAKDEIQKIEEEYKTRICGNCEYRDTERPTTHPNWRECNNRDSIMSYTDTHWEWGCNDFKRKVK